jgi:RHS repeat-associated protein
LGKYAFASKEISYEPAANAVNGTTYNDTRDIHDKWCTNYGYGDGAWLQVDLGSFMRVNRWKVVHEKGSGSGYTGHCTSDFRLQTYLNGNWVDIDLVKNNTEGITDRRVEPFVARSVRLYIDKADYDNCARIYEFQLYNDTVVRETFTQYDALSRPEIETNGYYEGNVFKGTSTTMTSAVDGSFIDKVEPNGKIVRSTYDQLGRILTVTDGLGLKNSGGTSIERIHKYAYDTYTEGTFALDRVAETDAYNNTSSKVTDVFGRIYIYTDYLGNKTKYEYDSAGYLRVKTDSENNVWKYDYDPFGRIIKETDPLGKYCTAEYDELGRNTAKVNKKGGRTIYTYDNNGNLLTIKDTYSNITSYTYDDAGNRITVTDPKLNKISYTYDALNRIVKTTDQAGFNKYFGYDSLGRSIWTTDRKNHRSIENGIMQISDGPDIHNRVFKYIEYDPFGRITSVRDEEGFVSRYIYDIDGRITSQIDPAGKTVTFKYDMFGRLTEKTDGNGKSEKYGYDLENRMISKTDRNQTAFSYTYDAMGRVTKQTAGSMTVQFTYSPIGHLKTIVDASGTTSFTYDVMGNLTKKTLPDTKYFEYRYDEECNKTYLKDPYAGEVYYTYDLMNRLTEVSVSGQKTTYTFDANGNRTSILLPNGAKTVFEFDIRNMNTKVVNTYGSQTTEYYYGYDENMLQTSKTEPSGTTTYEYDNLSRLTRAYEPTKSTIYNYDLSGNRKSQIVTTSSYESYTDYYYDGANRLIKTVETRGTSVAVSDMLYDDNGNLKLTNTTNMDGTKNIIINKYDVMNRLIETVSDQYMITAAYDAFGQRTSKTVNGTTTQYYNDGSNAILEVKSGAVTARNVFGLNLISRQDSGKTLYYQYNGHADVVVVTDSVAAVLNRYEYDAFGNVTFSNETVANPYRYSGYYFDKETGNYYLNARYYDPVNARFTTEDTYMGNYADPLSLNLYTYCLNNPVANHDPSGNFSLSDIGDAISDGWDSACDIASDVGDAIGTGLSYTYKGWSYVMTFGQSTDLFGDAWGIMKKGASFAWDVFKDNWDTLAIMGICYLTGGAINPIVLAMITGALKPMLSDIKNGEFSFDKMGKYLVAGVKNGAIAAVNQYTGGLLGGVMGKATGSLAYGIISKTVTQTVVGTIQNVTTKVINGEKITLTSLGQSIASNAIAGMAAGVLDELKVSMVEQRAGDIPYDIQVKGALSSMSGSCMGLSAKVWTEIGVRTLQGGLTEFSRQIIDKEGDFSKLSLTKIAAATARDAAATVGSRMISGPNEEMAELSGGPLYKRNISDKDSYFANYAVQKFWVRLTVHSLDTVATGGDMDFGAVLSAAGDTAMDFKNAALEIAANGQYKEEPIVKPFIKASRWVEKNVVDNYKGLMNDYPTFKTMNKIVINSIPYVHVYRAGVAVFNFATNPITIPALHSIDTGKQLTDPVTITANKKAYDSFMNDFFTLPKVKYFKKQY